MDNVTPNKRREEYFKGKWLLFSKIHEGMEFPLVEFEITEALIENYCRAMGDANPIYIDEKSAVNAGFESPIAPATIVCIYAIPSALLSGYKPKVIPPPGNIHYRQEYEFSHAVKRGDTIRVRSRVVNKAVRKGRKYVTIESVYTNQDGNNIAIGRITPVWAE